MKSTGTTWQVQSRSKFHTRARTHTRAHTHTHLSSGYNTSSFNTQESEEIIRHPSGLWKILIQSDAAVSGDTRVHNRTTSHKKHSTMNIVQLHGYVETVSLRNDRTSAQRSHFLSNMVQQQRQIQNVQSQDQKHFTRCNYSKRLHLFL